MSADDKPVVGLDGWPVGPPAESDAEWTERRFREDMRACERAWQQGVVLALADAVEACRLWNRPPPPWLAKAVGEALMSAMPAKARKDAVHYSRWSQVEELRARRAELRELGADARWEAVFDTASEALRGTAARGSPSAIRESYKLVQKAMKAGDGGRFYQPRSMRWPPN